MGWHPNEGEPRGYPIVPSLARTQNCRCKRMTPPVERGRTPGRFWQGGAKVNLPPRLLVCFRQERCQLNARSVTSLTWAIAIQAHFRKYHSYICTPSNSCFPICKYTGQRLDREREILTYPLSPAGLLVRNRKATARRWSRLPNISAADSTTDASPESNLSNDQGAQALATRRPRHPHSVVSPSHTHTHAGCHSTRESHATGTATAASDPFENRPSRNASFLAPIRAFAHRRTSATARRLEASRSRIPNVSGLGDLICSQCILGAETGPPQVTAQQHRPVLDP